jgi:hypothetical protein
MTSVKSQVLLPDAQGNVRETRKCAESEGAGDGGGDVEEGRGEKKDTPRPLQGESIALLQSQQRGNHP